MICTNITVELEELGTNTPIPNLTGQPWRLIMMEHYSVLCGSEQPVAFLEFMKGVFLKSISTS